eukprot:CAMPEP_0168182452 /NCGR_PEP_ID=MMETSP0139_2-20121125/11902_1 /TAXON_ID=44445 /ORGANISM="Pseudo-nitzschia australis, Strain 10249 10 AB" /LENGTH=124 /DNA_ID=CAMNT_0008103385 /DNA_START=85 /DNA_END=459 /DNA_ORIENTATION=+
MMKFTSILILALVAFMGGADARERELRTRRADYSDLAKEVDSKTMNRIKQRYLRESDTGASKKVTKAEGKKKLSKNPATAMSMSMSMSMSMPVEVPKIAAASTMSMSMSMSMSMDMSMSLSMSM